MNNDKVFHNDAYHHGLPLVIGHRGGAGDDIPENTIRAFAAGLAGGADVIETDVRLTKDGEVVIIHDADLGAVAAKDIAINDTSYATLQQVALRDRRGEFHDGDHVPLLADALQSFPDTAFNIDIKEEDTVLVEKTIELIRDLDAAGRVCLASFFPKSMARIKRVDAQITVSMDPGEVKQFLVAPRLMRSTARAIQVPVRWGAIPIVTRRLLRSAATKGVEVHVWTINNLDEARRLSRLGVNGLVTDYAALISTGIADLRTGR